MIESSVVLLCFELLILNSEEPVVVLFQMFERIDDRRIWNFGMKFRKGLWWKRLFGMKFGTRFSLLAYKC